jgi:uncharacterized protein YndB with AHSA1/START domain
MARMEASVVINRPVHEVFTYMADVGNWPQWNTGMLEAEQTSEGPMGVGATCRGVNQLLGRRMEWVSEVTEYEPNRKWGQKITSGPMSFEQSCTLEPVEGGTTLTLVGEGEMGGFFKLAEAMVNRSMQRQMEGNLANLKDILEAGA